MNENNAGQDELTNNYYSYSQTEPNQGEYQNNRGYHNNYKSYGKYRGGHKNYGNKKPKYDPKEDVWVKATSQEFGVENTKTNEENEEKLLETPSENKNNELETGEKQQKAVDGVYEGYGGLEKRYHQYNNYKGRKDYYSSYNKTKYNDFYSYDQESHGNYKDHTEQSNTNNAQTPTSSGRLSFDYESKVRKFTNPLKKENKASFNVPVNKINLNLKKTGGLKDLLS